MESFNFLGGQFLEGLSWGHPKTLELILRILNDFLEYIVINSSTNAPAGKCNFVNKGYPKHFQIIIPWYM